MIQGFASKNRRWLLLAFFAFFLPAVLLRAQDAGVRIHGVITDAQGTAVVNAEVTVTNAATGAAKTVNADGSGNYMVEGLPAGTYTVDAGANGFAKATKSSIIVTAGQTVQVSIALGVSSVMQQIEVNAGVDSIAAQAAPSGGFLDERSPQSLVSNTYIENYTSPVADFGELAQIVPGAFTTSSNGVGLGQSKTYFRAFADGLYNIDFDGIPFYDTNTPTHHSWAFFPSQWIGGVDFDRSPGTASTIGPTPFGGSMHLLSKPMGDELNVRGTVSYGTWNTKLFDGAFNSGNFGVFGGPKKSNLFADVHRMTSDGYQTFNFNERDAGSLLYQYTFSPRTVLTGFAGVVHLYSNGPNIASTRCMLYGAPADGSYSCASSTTASGIQPFTNAGLKFLLTDNSDPASWFDYKYNSYVVPTDFEYVGLKTEFGRGWYMEVKPYAYNYDNGEKYSNATPITYATTQAQLPGSYLSGKTLYYLGAAVAPCNVQVVKKGIAALPCGIDKYNSYRKYGETFLITQTSRFGVFRAGMWYEWAKSNRHQYPTDPLNNWADQALPKFAERFWTNSYQPFAEYEFHVTPKFNVTAGGKFSAYTFDVLHYADDGSTVGSLTCPNAVAACSSTISNHANFTAWLPSLDANYRIQPNWSIYGQVSTGSVVPPSATFDYNQTASSANTAVPVIQTPPKQQHSTAYQAGTVFKAQRLTLDGDAYYVRFQSGYSSTIDNVKTDPDYGDAIYYLQPSSVAKGLEFESTIVPVTGLNLYVNGSVGNGYYHGEMNAGTLASPFYQKAPSGLWVQQTPTDTESEGLSYNRYGFSAGIFNKRVGEERMDNGQYHNQAIVNPFSTLDGYFNYTLRNHSIFDQTKIRLSATNLLDAHNVQTLTLGNSPTTAQIPGGTLTDQFNATTAISGLDQPSLMAGRSFSVSVTFGFSPREH